MASSASLCCPIRQVVVHVYPGTRKAASCRPATSASSRPGLGALLWLGLSPLPRGAIYLGPNRVLSVTKLYPCCFSLGTTTSRVRRVVGFAAWLSCITMIAPGFAKCSTNHL